MINTTKSEKKRSSGGNYPAITFDELQRLKIPLPPPEVQDEIVRHVQAIYTQAKDLRREGQALLTRAKEEVERMILGV
ncbi:MAG: restriction endonuclease subunit S [Pyrinomonadaceae bacterium MAG19_C2-C3]|nr:restriction endonuclease subunit S [Pyrinomonadaceae bacterium MAG19_C2-C3]